MNKPAAVCPSIRSSRRKEALTSSHQRSEPPHVGCYNLLICTSLCALLTNALLNSHAQEVPGASSARTTSQISITVVGEYRIIHANGLPDHTPGRFPNPGNPNSIAPQHYDFRVPLNPQVSDKPTPFALGIFGIAINGVVFDPGANEWWNDDPRSGWQSEPMTGPRKLGIDQNNAHVQPTGAYHYHGLPSGLLANVRNAKQRMVLIGWAADGFPIYAPWAYSDPRNAESPLVPMKSSYRLKSRPRADGPPGNYDGSFVKDFEYVAGLGDLDECNGRFGLTPEFPNGTYQYFVTANFPFIPRMFRGTPEQSWFRRGGPPQGRPPGGPNFSMAPGAGFSPPPDQR
jgi:hypothetical protein